jgi:hypothetical protein
MKLTLLLLTCLLLFSSWSGAAVHNANLAYQSQPDIDSTAVADQPNLTTAESEVVALVNGTEAYDYDLAIEDIGLNRTLSDYSFRSAGSRGANETAKHIMKQFESFGLETHNETFPFTNWNLPTKPVLIIDEDGNPATTADQVEIHSFQSTHYSWPSPQGGVFADLVVLPLPAANNINEIGLNPIDTNAWNSIQTTGKILLIGREVTWDSTWHYYFRQKLTQQTPAAIIYTWWYSWMSFTPMMYGSAGGRPLSGYGSYFWNLQIPVGGVDYNEGLWIRNRENSINVSALFKIESVIGNGPHYNVIGKLTGYATPDKFVIISGHYDTITGAGFCDNGAGTAGVLESARVITDAVKSGLYRPKYSLLFIAFADEELGFAGAVYYVSQHKADMPNIVAVINLDCIGSDDFNVSETIPSGNLHLDQLVLQAASDLGVPAALTGTGGSDQEAFRDPYNAGYNLEFWWGVNPGISDAVPVQSSAILASEPLTYQNQWSTGTAGWIHTSYDNSSSTATLNWVEVNDLENHIKVAVLSILRVSPTPVHDLATLSLTVPKTIVGQGYSIQIVVIVKNLGDFTENFNVTLLANTTTVEKRETSLAEKAQISLTFTWNTADFAKGTWTVSAYADLIQGEIDTVNNTFVDGTVKVATPGDVNADGVVNVTDAAGVSAHWYPGPPMGPLGHDPNFDINGDVSININDAAIVSAYWTGPPKGPLAP